MLGINDTINLLGYADSKFLYYRDSAEKKHNRAAEKVFSALSPTAIFMAENKPFIAFFDSNEPTFDRELEKKIWNSQIPIVMVSFQDHIEVYNGCSINENKNLYLLEKIDSGLLSNKSTFSFWNISDPETWDNYQKILSTPKLDLIMLENIKDATLRLKETSCSPFAVRLILRLIFIRYLIDRGVDLDYAGLTGDIKEAQLNFLSFLNEKKDLYKLFKHLKEKFNGNLFEITEENQSEIDLLDNESLNTLRELMTGELILSSGQQSLFPMYDFNIIPVELISNIYEHFLGEEKQQGDKAFYTPPHLASYIFEQVISPHLSKNNSCKILDPACGSGIFLVESARKLIETNYTSNYPRVEDQELINIITDNIWGIDKNSEAIDVAIFSLYLTLLDYKDPKSLSNFKLPLLKNKNLFASDFFSPEIEGVLSGIQFDFIIGNPPWGNKTGLHVEYCKERKYPNPNNEIARSFIYRSHDFASKNTLCCLIVTSKIFYNKEISAQNFRKWLLENSTIQKYIELAAVRELIFKKVRGPAGIVIFNFDDSREKNLQNMLCHLTLKPNIFFKLFNIIVVEKNDYKYIKQSELVENDWVWKILVFGQTHDYELIRGLKEKYKTILNIITEKAIHSGRGICKSGTDKQDASHLKGKLLIDATLGIKPFEILIENAHPFSLEFIHRSKKDSEYLFQPPFALLKKGFDPNNFKLRSVYSEKEFIYTDAITGICGDFSQKEVLLCFVGLLNSSFYSYLNLMLGSSSGIEREQCFPTEVFEYPAIIEKQIAELVAQIQLQKEKERDSFVNSLGSENSISTLDKLILETFDLSDDFFIDYALNIQIPLIANNKMVWEEVSIDQLQKYISIIRNYFSEILQKNNKYMVCNIYKKIASHYCVLEFIIQDNEPLKTVIDHEITENNQFEFITKFTVNKINDQFYQLKDVIGFSENSFYIIKTNESKNWHPAIAKLDLSEIIDSILQ